MIGCGPAGEKAGAQAAYFGKRAAVIERAPVVDDVHTVDSDTCLQMERIPKSLAVIGGGVIGCEYASIFMALGADVALVDGRDRLVPFLEAEIAGRLRERFLSLGMHLWFNERPGKVENYAAGGRLFMKSGKTLETEAALFAAGRRAAVDGLAVEKAGLAINDKRYLPVDPNYRTTVPTSTLQGTLSAFPRWHPLPWSEAVPPFATRSD